MSQLNLKERLGVEPLRTTVVADCAALIDQQVKSKGGLSGIAIKGAYGTVKTLKKGFINEVINTLLDDWLDKLQPYHDAWSAGGNGTFAEALGQRSSEVAEDLLTVTDQRAQRTSHKTAKKAYDKMRGSAKKNVEEAVPELGSLLQRHVEAAG